MRADAQTIACATPTFQIYAVTVHEPEPKRIAPATLAPPRKQTMNNPASPLERGAHPDPITGVPETSTVDSDASNAANGAIAGAVAGAVVAGPVGAVIGATLGVIGGGLTDLSDAEPSDPA